MAHGYTKIEGKPIMIMAHGTVGLQHPSMAIYNCLARRVPLYIVLGNVLEIDYRRGIAGRHHSVQDAASKWDDAPAFLSQSMKSFARRN
jgi:acetolactate synthase-1/2/3 large subunit